MMKKSGIYKIQSVCKPDMIYIGGTVNLAGRRNGHFTNLKHNKHHSLILQSHANKYGIDDLVYSVLEECPVDQLTIREQYYLDLGIGTFNVRQIADRNLGVPCSDEKKAKISQAHIGNTYCVGHKASPETIQRLKDSHKGQASGMKGRHHTAEANEKNRQAHLGKKQSPETIAKRKGFIPWNKGLTKLGMMLIQENNKHRRIA